MTYQGYLHCYWISRMLNILEEVVSSNLIDKTYQDGSTSLNLTHIPRNSFVLLRAINNPSQTAIVRHVGKGKFKLIQRQNHMVEPKDSTQVVFLDSLYNPEVLLSVCVGMAGSGKSLLASSYAVSMYQTKRIPILLSKPTSTVGSNHAFGAVPGDVKEKYSPYLQSYQIVLEKLMGKDSKSYLKNMETQGDLQYIPIELARGCTFDNCTFILDEAQNLSWHELNTIISRMGNNTKMIVLGDLKQIDTRMSDKETGLYKLINSTAFQQSPISSGIQLSHQYRSPITQLIADVDTELREQGEAKSR